MEFGTGKGKGVKIFSYIVLALFALCCIIPLLNIIMISFTDSSSIDTYGYSLFPKVLTLEAYELLFENPSTLVDAYGVTLFVTIVGTFLAVLIGVQFAYGLSRKNYVLRNQSSFYLYFTMLFSGGTVPIYILVTQYLGLKNSLWALILPYIVTPYNIFLIRTFIQGLPDTVFEAAKIDGAGEYTILYKMVYPMCKGGIATVTLFYLLSFWNAWYPCLLYINKSKLYTLQYMLHVLMGKIETLNMEVANGMAVSYFQQLPEDSLRMATCLVAIGPLIVAFPFFQKYFVRGIAVGEVKG